MPGRYRIRDERFAVHLEKIVAVDGPNGTKGKRRVEQSHFAGAPIELEDVDAISHVHKLEPIDEAAKKLFADFYARQDRAQAGRGSGADDISDEVLDKLAARLAARKTLTLGAKA